MRVSLAWLGEFVDLPESFEELRATLDDLGLVVEGVESVGAGLEDVVVARVDEIHAIEGADRIRRVIVEAGSGPVEIVCGAMNFEVGDLVPLAPVGAVLPGGFAIGRRTMRGVTSNGMLCSARELGLADDHQGLMVLDGALSSSPGQPLLEALGIERDVVVELSIEGNRPDAWCVEGVARDLAVRLERSLRAPLIEVPSSGPATQGAAAAHIEAPDLCGRLTVSVLRGVKVGPSPRWVARKLEAAGMRPISNIVDASNLVMLELGQPTHPYDAAKVVGRSLGARRARAGETLVTLDGVERALARPGRGLGDTGEDCVIVDGADRVLGLAGIMGGAESEIDDGTTEVLLEAAFFDPMAIARSSKRHGLRTEASARFERGVDPQLALRAVGRLVAVLRETCPDLEWLADPLDVRGEIPEPPTILVRPEDVQRTLGTPIAPSDVERLLRGLGFATEPEPEGLMVTAPTARLDVRSGVAGRADVIEEVARLYGYRRLGRETPTWPQPGGLSARQRMRRQLRDTLVALGVLEAWTPSLGDDHDFDLTGRGVERIRITNPLASEESVLRATLLTGLLRAWARNLDRGLGDEALAEIGVVFTHPSVAHHPRHSRGGAGGVAAMDLPEETERLTVLLAREEDDATVAVALWRVLAEHLDLGDVRVRSLDEPRAGLHPTRGAALVEGSTEVTVGYVGEVDPDLVEKVAPGARGRRLGVIDVDLEVLADETRVPRRNREAVLPSRFPSALYDLAFVVPDVVGAEDLAGELAAVDARVESVELFDVFRGGAVGPGVRSLAFRIRLSSPDHTLSEAEVTEIRAAMIERGAARGARLR